MVKKLTIAAVVVLMAPVASIVAIADGKKDCTTVAQADWKPRTEAEAVANAAGHTVRGSKIEGSCYEVYAISKNGDKIELFYNPIDLALMKTVIK